MKAFANQVAVVTGASSAIGRAIALALAARGAALCLIGRDEQRLEATAEAARQKNVAVQVFRMDLTEDDEVRRLVSHLKHDHHGIDVLVHCSGAYHKGTIELAP